MNVLCTCVISAIRLGALFRRNATRLETAKTLLAKGDVERVISALSLPDGNDRALPTALTGNTKKLISRGAPVRSAR